VKLSSSHATRKNTSKALGAALLLALASLPAFACGSPSAAEDIASGTEALKISPHIYYTCEPTNQCSDSNWVPTGAPDGGPVWVGNPTLCGSITGCSWDNCTSQCPFYSPEQCTAELGCAFNGNDDSCAPITPCPSGIVSDVECAAVASCNAPGDTACAQTTPCPTGTFPSGASCTHNLQCAAQKHFVP
jgi:hypothetical protein